MRQSTRWKIRFLFVVASALAFTCAVWCPILSEASRGFFPISEEGRESSQSVFVSFSLPPIRVVEAEEDWNASGSTSRWYEFALAPADVDRLKQGITDYFVGPSHEKNRAIEPGTLQECIAPSMELSGYPAFWKPEALSDGEALRVGPYPYRVYIFSSKTGTIYYYRQGT